MKNTLMLAAGALAFAATPALAGPPAHAGKGKAKHHQQHVMPSGGPGYGQGHCPPGLQNKGCMPPGQAKKMYEQGYRFPNGYSQWTPYNNIPYDVRRHYDLDPRGRYIYDNNYVYRVDPATLVVREVLNAIF